MNSESKLGLFGFAKKTILPFILGLIVNIILAFIFLGAWLNGATIESTPLGLILFACFLLLFPFLYFWMVRTYALRKGIEFVYQSSNSVSDQAIDTIVSSFVIGKETIDNTSGVVGDTLNGAADYVKNMGVSKHIGKVLTLILSRVPIMSTLREIKEEVDFKEENLPLIQTRVKSSVADYIESELIGMPSFWLWGLILVNAGSIFLAWKYFV